MTRKEAFSYGKEQLEKAGITDWQWDSEVLLEYVLGCNRTSVLLDGAKEMSRKEEEEYRKLIEKRAGHFPLQYITGEQFFMGLPFRVSPDVLIPRQDTEILVEEVLSNLESRKAGKDKIQGVNGERIDVLDMCTGSGCIAISIERLWKKKSNKHMFVAAADVSSKALEMAKKNAELNGSRVEFLESDLFSEIGGRFDVIVSNPPYIASREVETLMEEVRLHEPRIALDGKEDGLFFYDRIIKEAPAFLKKNGWLFFETGYDQGQSVPRLMEEAGFADIQVKKDLAGLDRVVYGRICHV